MAICDDIKMHAEGYSENDLSCIDLYPESEDCWCNTCAAKMNIIKFLEFLDKKEVYLCDCNYNDLVQLYLDDDSDRKIIEGFIEEWLVENEQKSMKNKVDS